MDDAQILDQIKTLVDREHQARAAAGRGELDPAQEREQIAGLERALDQCWDLLRQRRARREFGEDPDDAQARPESQVEGYRQ